LSCSFLFDILHSSLDIRHKLMCSIFTTGITSGARTGYPSEAHGISSGFMRGSCSSIFFYTVEDHCLSFWLLSLDHCIVCPFSCGS